MCMGQYFDALLYLNSQRTAPDSLSSMASDAGSSSNDRNASEEEKSTGVRQALARLREIFQHRSA
jgi:hypothetical protein